MLLLLLVLLLSILYPSKDDIFLFAVDRVVLNHLSRLFVIYSLIALRRVMTAMKSDVLTNEDSNGFHNEDFDDEVDTASDCCRICRGSSEAASKLIHPCNCSGSIMYVHFNCLKDWFRFSTSITNVILPLRKSLSCATCQSQYKGLIARKKLNTLFSYVWNDPWNLYSFFYGPQRSAPDRVTVGYLCLFLKMYIYWTAKSSDHLILLLLRMASDIFIFTPFFTIILLFFLELGVQFVNLEMSYILVGHEIFITRDFIERERLNETTGTANEESNMNRQ